MDRQADPRTGGREHIAAVLFSSRAKTAERRILILNVDPLHPRRKERRHRVGR